jgi:hypothetical protein
VKVHANELGVDVSKVKIVDNRFRWGSCPLDEIEEVNTCAFKIWLAGNEEPRTGKPFVSEYDLI